jgi:cation transport regulator ChaC
VTLVEDRAESCVGRAFHVSTEVHAEVIGRLDVREKAGYERHSVQLDLVATGRRVHATVYMANANNPNYLGPSNLQEMVAHIGRARGRSGTNVEYLLELSRWLRRHGVTDPHVESLTSALRSAATP